MILDDAYANSAHIPDGDGYYGRWDAVAKAYRDGRGVTTGGPVDWFVPDGASRGTVVFVHGGYWLAGSPAMFSHLAAGAVDAGYTCALVRYTLAPDARISEITREIAGAMGDIAGQTVGPMYLAGHSAGGHLVARMGCMDMAAPWSKRIARILAISPLGDLAPLLQTSMNTTLGLDAIEARAESPIHHTPQDLSITAWVGSAERPVFLDQARGLQQAWGCDLVIDDGRHHFDVIEGLETPDSAMMRALFAPS